MRSSLLDLANRGRVQSVPYIREEILIKGDLDPSKDKETRKEDGVWRICRLEL